MSGVTLAGEVCCWKPPLSPELANGSVVVMDILLDIMHVPDEGVGVPMQTDGLCSTTSVFVGFVGVGFPDSTVKTNEPEPSSIVLMGSETVPGNSIEAGPV